MEVKGNCFECIGEQLYTVQNLLRTRYFGNDHIIYQLTTNETNQKAESPD